MSIFKYYTPTKVLMGNDIENHVGNLITEYGYHSVLIHYGGQSAIKSGLLSRVENSLKENNVNYVLLGGVVPNPRLSKVYEGIELCKKHNVDFILAVGGGSVLDSAKAIALGAVHDFDVWDIYLQKQTATSALPVGTVLTLGSAGSEMSASSVITNDDNLMKRGANSDLIRCKFALLNPSLTTTLPTYQTFSGVTDTMMHTIERYFTNGPTLDITEGIAVALLKNVMNHARVLLKDPNNLKSRTEILWCSSLSHNDLTNFGGDRGDWATHRIEHELSGRYDVTHAPGLAAVWGSWARHVMHHNIARFKKFAVDVFDVDPSLDDETAALKGISSFENFLVEIGMPINLKDLGLNITEVDAFEMAQMATNNDTMTVGGFKLLNLEDIKNIYLAAK